MTLFIARAPAGTFLPLRAEIDVAVISNGDMQLGFNPVGTEVEQVTYAQTNSGNPPTRLNALVNTNFGVNPENIDIIIAAVGGNFVLNNGVLITTIAGITLAPAGSGGPGSDINTTTACIALYDSSQANGAGYCVARQGSGGILDLDFPGPVILYHELSHAFRVATNSLQAITAGCNPSSPEERAAIIDENDLRTQIAAVSSSTAVLRDPGIHCGGNGCVGSGPGGVPTINCCIVATVATGSHLSAEVGTLRDIRDSFLRKTETGYDFFQQLHHAYYGFSPEVVRLMAMSPPLLDLVRKTYVQPLVVALETADGYCRQGLRGEALGAYFQQRCKAVGCSDLTNTEIDAAWALLGGNEEAISELNPAPGSEQLAQVLRSRALPDPHVSWALVAPIEMYLRAVRAIRQGLTTSGLGLHLEESLETWTARLPIGTFWASLTESQARQELQFLQEVLTVSPSAFAVFRKRLADAFPASNSIQRSVVDMQPER